MWVEGWVGVRGSSHSGLYSAVRARNRWWSGRTHSRGIVLTHLGLCPEARHHTLTGSFVCMDADAFRLALTTRSVCVTARLKPVMFP